MLSVFGNFEMQVGYKLDEARYFLDKLKTLDKGSDDFMFNLSAFLTAWRSVIDVMLYDYMEKYFGFAREERFDGRDFEIAARASGNQDAIQFCDWWRAQIEVLKKNPLWRKRTISVHRGRPPLKMHMLLRESIALTPGFVVSLAPGAVVSVETPVQGIRIIPPTPRVAREVYFDDFPTKDIIDVCEEGFQQIKEMVEEAESTFGNS